MLKFAGFAMALTLVCLLSADAALAQGRGGRGGPGGGGFGGGVATLVAFPQVQKELKLTDEQVALVKELQQAAQGQGGQRTRGQNLTDAERQERRDQAEKRNEERTAKVTALLTDEQNTRLKQIQLWVQGAVRLADNADVAKQLSLTDDQKGALKTINEESSKKRGEMMQKMRGASEDQRKEITTQVAGLRNDAEAEALAVLTDEQKTQFASLRGPKFELDMAQAFQGGGRGRRRGNSNN